MKIEQASVELTTAHDLSCERQLDYESSVSFRQVYTDVKSADAETCAAQERERLLLLVERLTRGLIELIFGETGSSPVDIREILSAESVASGGATTDAPAGRGMLCFDWTTRTTETVSEHERTQFSAQGQVRTADGRTLEFDLGLSMCRDFTCTREQIRTGTTELRDPLVINFDGKACELSGKRFAFDLDLDPDAQKESIPVLGSGSGYLALDRNQDGRINDGGELFGASSGDGFADLAKFDQDGNGWIDEADPVFERLRVWRTNGEGEGQLTRLRDEGVGAIRLESARSPFKLADSENQTLGQIRATGIYLRENGSVGTVQQVDLSV